MQLLQFDGITNNPFMLKLGNFSLPTMQPCQDSCEDSSANADRSCHTQAAARNSSCLKTYVCSSRLITISPTHGTQLYWPRGLNTTFTWCTWLQTPCSPCGEASRGALCKENLHDSARRICSTVLAAVVKSCRLLSDQQHTQGARDLSCLPPSSAIRHLTSTHCGVWMRRCAKVSPSKPPTASCFSPRFLPRGVTFTGLCTHSVERCIVRALRDCSQLRSDAGVSDSEQRAKDCKGRWSVSSGDSGELVTRLFRLTLRLKRAPENIQWWAGGTFRKLSRVQLNHLLSPSTYHTISLSRGIGCSGHEGEDAAGGVRLRRIDPQKVVLTFWINTDCHFLEINSADCICDTAPETCLCCLCSTVAVGHFRIETIF